MKKHYREILSFGLLSVLVVGLVVLLTGCGPLYPPEAKISTDPPVTNGTVSVGVNEDVDFDASASTANGDATIDTYDWDFGDGNSDSGVNVTHSYDSTGTYTVELKVTDDNGNDDTATVTVEVTDLTASFTISANPATKGTQVDFDASASTGDIQSYDWFFKSVKDNSITGTGETTSYTYTQTGSFLVALRVTASDGDVAGTADTIIVEE